MARYRRFLAEAIEFDARPRAFCLLSLRGFRAMLQARQLYRNRGLCGVAPLLGTTSPPLGLDDFEKRRHANAYRVAYRWLFGRQLCLEEALIIAAALRADNVAAQVAIGCSHDDRPNGTRFHAWVVHGNQVLTDTYAADDFLEMARWP